MAQQDVTYGLIQRPRPSDGAAAATSNGRGSSREAILDREAQVLKEDLNDLPPEASLEAYEAMPVEAFGEALFRGMGWVEGRAVGRNTKEEVKATELVRRPQRLGLGAAPAPEQPKKKIHRPGAECAAREARQRIRPPRVVRSPTHPPLPHFQTAAGEAKERKDLVYVDPNGVERAQKPVGAALSERRKEGVHPGKRMRVAGGRHSGLTCEVLSLEPKEEGRSARARVRLLPSHESVSVRCSELEEERGSGSGSGSGGAQREAEERRRGGSSQQKRGREEKGAPPTREPEERPWLVPSIR